MSKVNLKMTSLDAQRTIEVVVEEGDVLILTEMFSEFYEGDALETSTSPYEVQEIVDTALSNQNPSAVVQAGYLKGMFKRLKGVIE